MIFVHVLLSVVGALPLSPERIDARLAARWEPAVRAAPVAPLPTLLRRISLDLTGSMPKQADVQAALACALDLEGLIGRTLESAAFARHWGRVVARWLIAQPQIYQPVANRSLGYWVERQLAHHEGLDAIARELVSAEGTSVDHPGISYFLQFREAPENLAGHLAKTFLGAQIQCAQCHDHPFEKWTKADFAGFMANFKEARVTQWPRPLVDRLLAGERVTPEQAMTYMPRYVRAGFTANSAAARRVQDTMDRLAVLIGAKTGASGSTGVTSVAAHLAAIGLPRESTGSQTPQTVAFVLDRPDEPEQNRRMMKAAEPAWKTASPRFLDGATPPHAGTRLRTQLATWMTADHHFARAMVNRVWKQLLGRGLVEPVDNLYHPDDIMPYAELLEELSAGFEAHHYQLVWLVRTIVQTQAYRRVAGPARGTYRFQHALVRPLFPGTVVRAMLEGTGGSNLPETADREATLTDQLATVLAPSSGNGDSQNFTIQDALYLMNGPVVNRVIPANLAAPAETDQGVNRRWVQDVFLRLYCRRAEAAEEDAALKALAADRSGTAVLWPILASVEFWSNY
jgi:hypothetical protein